MTTQQKPSSGLAESVAMIVQLLRENGQAKRDGVKSEAVVEIAGKATSVAKSIVDTLAHAPITGQMLATFLATGEDIIQTKFEEMQLDPCQAAEPARQLLRVFESYQTAGVTLRAFANDKRFHRLSSPLRRLENRVPVRQINAKVIELAGIFGTALQAAELAATKVYLVRHPLVHLGAHPGVLPPAAVPAAVYLIKLPRSPFTTEGQRVRKMRRLMIRLADELLHEAEVGRETLMRSALDTELRAVRPEAVSGAVRSASYTIACCLLTCAALLDLLGAPMMIESAAEGDNKWA